MDRPVKRRVWRRILLASSGIGLLAVIGLVVWLSTGGWSDVKLSVKLSRQVMQFRADTEAVLNANSHQSFPAREKQMVDRWTEVFAALEEVGPDRPAFRWAYRDIIIIAAPELYQMNYFRPSHVPNGESTTNYRRAIFLGQLADTLRKHPKVCLPVVLGLLDHPDPEVQAVAVGCVWLHPVSPGKTPPEPQPPLNLDFTEYLRAVEEHQKEFVAKLIPMLRHPRPEVRVMVAEIMKRGFVLLEPRVTIELANQFRVERHPHVAGAMASGLAPIPHWRRWRSAEGKQALPLIAEALLDPDKRRMAVDQLVPAGPEARAAIPYAVQVLREADAEGQLDALRLLQATSPDAKATAEAVPALIELLRSTRKYDCQMNALGVLKALGPEAKEAAPAVRELTEDKNSILKTFAADTLKAIAP
jgi:hypothetical protein